MGKSRKRKYPREYSAWTDMKTRCYNSGHNRFNHYGGRGIIVCDRWLHSFPNFLIDMGLCPPKLTLDRIDVDGNYSPQNCRWASNSVQAINTKKEISGAHYKKANQRWGASISIDNKLRHLGCFATKEEAQAAYLYAANERLKIYLQRDMEVMNHGGI